jgi:hypothetical protein
MPNIQRNHQRKDPSPTETTDETSVLFSGLENRALSSDSDFETKRERAIITGFHNKMKSRYILCINLKFN